MGSRTASTPLSRISAPVRKPRSRSSRRSSTSQTLLRATSLVRPATSQFSTNAQLPSAHRRLKPVQRRLKIGTKPKKTARPGTYNSASTLQATSRRLSKLRQGSTAGTEVSVCPRMRRTVKWNPRSSSQHTRCPYSRCRCRWTRGKRAVRKRLKMPLELRKRPLSRQPRRPMI